MSYKDLVEQGRRSFEGLKILKLGGLASEASFPAWNGLNIDDLLFAYGDLMSDLAKVYEGSSLERMPFNIINGLNSQMAAAAQQGNQLLSTKQSQFFQQFFQSIEGLRTNLRSWGVLFQAVLGQEIEDKVSLLNQELGSAASKRAQIDQLALNVEQLIEPAVAGSLSKSFSDRRAELNKNQKKWFWVSVGSAIAAVLSTTAIIYSIVGLFSDSAILDTVKKYAGSVDRAIWLAVVLRLASLVPIYSIFGFAFMQYRKERDLEEEYAHKSAVATSLPNYGGLAVDDKVKDQILSEASKVIFSTPALREALTEKPTNLDQVSRLLGSIQKLIPGAAK